MKRTLLSLFAAMLAASFTPIFAQEEGDAPDKGVARISLINGEVSVRHGDSGDQTAAAVNAPVLAGDRILTDQTARAEVQFDYANLIRLGPMTELRMGELAYRRYEVQLATGTVMVRVMRDNDAQFEIGTPSVSVRPKLRGSYRISVLPDGTGEISVRSGEAEVFTPRGSEVVRAGKTMQVRGDPSDPEFQIINEIPLDEFDRWNTERDRAFDQSTSYRYVPPDVYGAESLDPYGQWVYDAPYGWVWVPRVDLGWAPYRVGRWSYVDYYGWTWISGDPWGWAPYHYGRWYFGGRGWAWYPGAFGPRYYWRPALVGFFGWGSGVGFGFGFGNVGWVPLAPFEVFRPWYGPRFGGGRTINNITIVNNTNITNIYRNARFVNDRSGVTSVRASDFGRRGVDSRSFVRAGAADLRNAGQVRGALPFQGSAESRRFSDRTVNASAFPKTDNNTRFFNRASVRGGARDGAANPSANIGGPRGPNPQGGNSGPIFRGGAVDAPQRGNVAGGGNSVNADRGNPTADRGGNGWRRLGDTSPGGNPSGVNPGSNAPNARSRESLRQSPPGAPGNPATRAPGNGWRRFEQGGTRDFGNRGAAPQIGGDPQVQRSQSPRAIDRGAAPDPGNGGFRGFNGNNGGRLDRGGGPSSGPAVIPFTPQQPSRLPDVQRGGPRADPPAQPRMDRSGNGPRANFSVPQGGGFRGQQPVQINPPMVRDRGGFGGGGGQRSFGAPNSAPRSFGGGGGAPPMSGGGGGAARPGGGGGGGGGNRGGGGGGGHRGR
jgi:hypothetical protein